MVRLKFYRAKPCVQFHYPTATSGQMCGTFGGFEVQNSELDCCQKQFDVWNFSGSTQHQ